MGWIGTVRWGNLEWFLNFTPFVWKNRIRKKWTIFLKSWMRYSTTDPALADGNFFGSIRNKTLKTCLFQVTRVRGNIEQ